MAISASEARKNLYGLIKQVSDDADSVEIVSKHGNAVLVSAEEWRAMQETVHLVRSPANAARLLESVEGFAAGTSQFVFDSVDEATEVAATWNANAAQPAESSGMPEPRQAVRRTVRKKIQEIEPDSAK
jgi:antitoxin YefM